MNKSLTKVIRQTTHWLASLSSDLGIMRQCNILLPDSPHTIHRLQPRKQSRCFSALSKPSWFKCFGADDINSQPNPSGGPSFGNGNGISGSEGIFKTKFEVKPKPKGGKKEIANITCYILADMSLCKGSLCALHRNFIHKCDWTRSLAFFTSWPCATTCSCLVCHEYTPHTPPYDPQKQGKSTSNPRNTC